MRQQLQMLLILVPVIASVLVAFANKVQQGDRWLALRAGAEEILKEIYRYRTLLQTRDDRRRWLDQRVAEIKVKLAEATGGELVLKPYEGPIPPYYNPDANPPY